MKLQIELELKPIAINLLMEIGELEESEPEKVLQTLIIGFIHDRLIEEGNYLEKPRIRCQFCNSRFTPKRSTKKFCNPVCRNKSNIQETKLFIEHNIYSQLYKFPYDIRKSKPQIELMRELLRNAA